jgi:hypothetical protein
MSRLTNEEKAILYNNMLFTYQKLQEEVSQIKLKNFEVSAEDQKSINSIENRMKRIYSDVQKLYHTN